MSLGKNSVRYMKRFSLLLQEIFLQAFPDCLNFSFWNAKMKKIFGHRKSGTQQQIKWHFYDVYFRKHLLLLCKVCFRKYESIHRLPMYRTQVAANSAWQQTDLKNLLFFIPKESEIEYAKTRFWFHHLSTSVGNASQSQMLLLYFQHGQEHFLLCFFLLYVHS